MRRLKIAVGILLVSYAIVSQGASGTPVARQKTDAKQTAPTSETPLKNGDITGMLKARIAQEVVIAKIKASVCDFDTSPDALKALKAANVPDGVILAMVQASAYQLPEQPQQEITVDQIIENYVKALGGRAAIEKTTSLVLKGTWTSGFESGAVQIYTKAPNKSLRVMQVPSYGQVQDGFDGTVGWSESPEDGVKVISGQELNVMRRTAEFHEELRLQTLYPKIILKGEQNVGARMAYVIEANSGDGILRQMYFDSETALLIEDATEYDTPEGRTRVTGRFEDYRDIDGVKIPFTQQSFDNTGTLTLNFTEARFDVALDDAMFTRPTTGTITDSEAPPQLTVMGGRPSATQSEHSDTTAAGNTPAPRVSSDVAPATGKMKSKGKKTVDVPDISESDKSIAYAVRATTDIRDMMIDPTAFTLLQVIAITKKEKDGSTSFRGCVHFVGSNRMGGREQQWGPYTIKRNDPLHVYSSAGNEYTGCYVHKDEMQTDVTSDVEKYLSGQEQ